MPNRKGDNDYPTDIGDIDYIDETRSANFTDEPIAATDDQDKAEFKRQLAKDKDHPAFGLDEEVDEDD